MLYKLLSILIFLVSVNNSIFSQKPVGLNNQGNTCFMNSLLQSLYNIDELTDYLIKNSDIYKDGTVAREYIAFLKQYNVTQQDHRKSFAPLNFCTKIWSLKDVSGDAIFPKGQFGDAQELLSILLDRLKDQDIDKNIINTRYGFPFNDNIKTYISNLFDIIIRRTYKTHSNELYVSGAELTDILSLPIQDLFTGNISKTLDESLDRYFSTEKINVKIYDKNQEVELQKKIIKLPKRLNVHYRRWDPTKWHLDSAGRRVYEKIYNSVAFPIENLNLNKYLSKNAPKNQQSIYDLNAIIMHHGPANHYSAYIKNNNNWYYCNDESVTLVSTDHIRNIAKPTDPTIKEHQDPTPYLLFYEQLPQILDILYPPKITKEWLLDELQKYYDLNTIDIYLTIFNKNLNKDMVINNFVNGINDQFLTLDWIVRDIQDTTRVNPKVIIPNSLPLEIIISNLSNLSWQITNLDNRIKELKK